MRCADFLSSATHSLRFSPDARTIIPLAIQNAHESFLKQTLVEVWRQVLVENASVIELGGKRYSVRTTPEQNPDTKSRWAVLARNGKKAMQFLIEGRCVANVVNGTVTLYGR